MHTSAHVPALAAAPVAVDANTPAIGSLVSWKYPVGTFAPAHVYATFETEPLEGLVESVSLDGQGNTWLHVKLLLEDDTGVHEAFAKVDLSWVLA